MPLLGQFLSLVNKNISMKDNRQVVCFTFISNWGRGVFQGLLEIDVKQKINVTFMIFLFYSNLMIKSVTNKYNFTYMNLNKRRHLHV